MTIRFADGTELNAVQLSEDKRIYSEPKKWELKITSDTELTSEKLDETLTAANTAKITYVKNDGTESEFSGYDYTDRIAKTYTDSGVTLVIILQKGAEENEA